MIFNFQFSERNASTVTARNCEFALKQLIWTPFVRVTVTRVGYYDDQPE